MSDTDIATALSRVEVGDILFCETPSGLDKIMLVFDSNDDTISARHVTSQTKAEISRHTGNSLWAEGGGSCMVVSIHPVEPDTYAAIIGLDRKMRLSTSQEEIRLSEIEKRLLVSIGILFRKHPLYPTE